MTTLKSLYWWSALLAGLVLMFASGYTKEFNILLSKICFCISIVPLLVLSVIDVIRYRKLSENKKTKGKFTFSLTLSRTLLVAHPYVRLVCFCVWELLTLVICASQSYLGIW